MRLNPSSFNPAAPGPIGGTTPDAITGTTGTFSGLITSTLAGAWLTRTGATTGSVYQDVQNTSGRYQFGVEQTGGGGILTGSTGYATVLTTTGNTVLQFGANNTLALTVATNGSVNFNTGNANGQIMAVQSLTELTTIAAAATTDTAIQMPANSIVLAVDVRVTTVIPTAATFTVGDSGSAARFSTAAVAVAAGSTDPGTKAGAYYNASALAVRITPDVQPAANTGRVRVTIHYIAVTPATS